MAEHSGPVPGTPSVDETDGDTGTAQGTIDAEGCLTGWNGGAERMLGYPAAEVVGRPAALLLAEPVSSADVLRALTADPERWSGRLSLRHRDGHRVDAALLAHRTRSDTGPDTWRIVCSVDGAQVRREDDDLARWAFEQMPRCAVSIYDADLRYRRSNRAMVPVVGLSDDAVRGLRINDITTQPQTPYLAEGLRRAAGSGEPYHLESFQRTGGQRRAHAWSVDFAPLKDPGGETRGVALIAHDTSEQYWARKRLILLNDAASRIGSTLDVAQTARELLEVTVAELADFGSVDLLTALEKDAEVDEGALTGTVTLRRVAHRFAPGTSAELTTVVKLGATAVYPEFTPPARALASGTGVLSNAEDPDYVRWMHSDPRRDLWIRKQGYHTMIAVPLRARGATLGVALFYRRGRPERMERFTEDDVLLVEELAARAAVAIDNAHRYTRERETALSLQRSLLPQRLPEQGAVDVATRYIPAGARSGIGGDWFDVIPLSGARVALVVGDVVGHGIHASATMGRLRTAVRTLADVDLPPDELLTHLDDLVIHLSAETEAAGYGSEIAATCCYAVYNPVSRLCTFASAGHPPPVFMPPGGPATRLRVSTGPPLGLGGLPFESRDVEVPEGSLLVLCSDGLIKTRDHDMDQGYEQLCRTLSSAGPSLEKTCDTILNTLVPDRSQDDVALLVARTRVLDTRHVATWSIPRDTASVAQARHGVRQCLSAWGLPEATYATELIASELVTNAIRHAAAPISLRLIFNSTLICEVSDASSTTPHLRRARAFDEGGRGLMLVAQIADRWGTRHTATGKTIWAEQTLSP